MCSAHKPDNDSYPATYETYANWPQKSTLISVLHVPTNAAFLLYWRWRQHISPKRRYVSTKTHHARSKITLIGVQIKILPCHNRATPAGCWTVQKCSESVRLGTLLVQQSTELDKDLQPPMNLSHTQASKGGCYRKIVGINQLSTNPTRVRRKVTPHNAQLTSSDQIEESMEPKLSCKTMDILQR
jgi:hypothetical protein